MKNHNGYTILILVTLIATVGIGSALYYLTSKKYMLKEVSSDVQTNQALNCSESGNNIANDCLNNAIKDGTWDNASTVTNCDTSGYVDLTSEGENGAVDLVCQYKINIEPLTDEIYMPILERDNTELILLNSGVNGITSLHISWKPQDVSAGNVLELNLVKDNTTDMTLNQTDYSCMYGGIANTAPNADAFENANVSDNICSIDVDVTNMTFAQITPRYNNASDVSVTLTSSDSNFQLQGYKVMSTGKSGYTIREIESIFLYSSKYGFARLLNDSIYTKDVQ